MVGTKAEVEAGNLMSYGADLNDLYRRSAVYIDKILKGAKPADLPVEQASKYQVNTRYHSAPAQPPISSAWPFRARQSRQQLPCRAFRPPRI
jgi:hypothetical protein